MLARDFFQSQKNRESILMSLANDYHILKYLRPIRADNVLQRRKYS